MEEPKRKKKSKRAVKEKRVTREQRVATLREHARDYAFSYNPQIIDLTIDAEECARATRNTCWRPDIFLNSGRSCHNCVLVEHCACPSKRIDKKAKNVSR